MKNKLNTKKNSRSVWHLIWQQKNRNSHKWTHLSPSAGALNDFGLCRILAVASGGVIYCTIEGFFYASSWRHTTRFSKSRAVLKRFGCHTVWPAPGLDTFNKCIHYKFNHVMLATGNKPQLLPLFVGHWSQSSPPGTATLATVESIIFPVGPSSATLTLLRCCTRSLSLDMHWSSPWI